jgi:hypothetical protein
VDRRLTSSWNKRMAKSRSRRYTEGETLQVSKRLHRNVTYMRSPTLSTRGAKRRVEHGCQNSVRSPALGLSIHHHTWTSFRAVARARVYAATRPALASARWSFYDYIERSRNRRSPLSNISYTYLGSSTKYPLRRDGLLASADVGVGKPPPPNSDNTLSSASFHE